MIYILYGLEDFLINNEIDNIKKKYKIDEINIVKYDLENTLLKDIIEDSQTISFFSDKKLIIVDNSYIFTRNTSKKLEQDTCILENYIKNSNSDTILVFIVHNEKIDSVKKITKLIKEKGVVKDFNTNNNIENTIKSMFDDYQIDYGSIKLLIDRVGKNLDILNQEIEKLKLYKINEKIITKEDVLALTTKNVDTDIFKFIDNIISKNKKEAITTYNELLKLNEEPIKIITILANKFRLMYQACTLTKKGYSEQNISDILKVHKYPVSLAIQAGLRYDTSLLLSYIEKLADLDINIKTGNIDKELALELFILEL